MKIINQIDRSDYGQCVFCGCHAIQFDYENGLSDLTCAISVGNKLPCRMTTVRRKTTDAANLVKHWVAGGLMG